MALIFFFFVFTTPSLTMGSISLKFAEFFQDGAVLQRGMEASVWGTSGAKSGTLVTLYVDGVKAVSAKVNASGNWTAKLPRYKPAFDRTLTIHDGTSNVSVNVSFGDVILCSGQSNMGMPVGPNKNSGFNADNATAESAASGRYNGKIWLMKPNKGGWFAPSPKALQTFSAICWYTGKILSEYHHGNVPIGLIEAAVGGSPIEYWIPSDTIHACETDIPVCDDHLSDSVFYEEFIQPLQPYTIGSVIWDQAERDLKCNHTEIYPCLERGLIANWRQGFDSLFSFVVVQLPGYFDHVNLDEGLDSSDLFRMRLAQETGFQSIPKTSITATYDLSCYNCWSHGTVHNPDKSDVGLRVSLQLRHLRGEDIVFEGPRATSVSMWDQKIGTGVNKNFTIKVTFSGGTKPFYLKGTRNCTACCKAMGDFDVSIDGITWTNGTTPVLTGDAEVSFSVILQAPPKMVRYTAAGYWPQCAIYNQEALPAMPFQMPISSIKKH